MYLWNDAKVLKLNYYSVDFELVTEQKIDKNWLQKIGFDIAENGS